MKRMMMSAGFAGAVLLALALSVQAAREARPVDASLHVMSYNIRCIAPEANIKDYWFKRQGQVAGLIRRYAPDVAGLQEVKPQQARDLARYLTEYQFYGVPRDDGVKKGEMCAIFYRPDRVTLLEQGTFWLSATPEVAGSNTWGAACRRVVSWAKFHHLASDRDFYFFNTHFDHVQIYAREQSAQLLVEKIPAIAGDAPVIVTGDFNSQPDSKPYQTIIAKLTDARGISSTPPAGPEKTDWPFKPGAPPTVRIDYIFLTKGIGVSTFATLEDIYGQGQRRPSDHMPLKATLQLP
jgi:endonuclease/exonuclease/phosphatase family metal-dependent hydrolase